MPENGHYVTRGEFNIVYDDVKEIKADVKKLLAAQAGDDAIAERDAQVRDHKAMIRPALFATFVSSVVAIVIHFF